MFAVDTSTISSGIPAPFWFVEFFKVLGFILHIFAMNLWFAGLPLAILAFVFSTKNSRRFARRMFSQLPVITALGINFGIVPLLFIQVAYYKMFYSATIFMAWHWILVIPLLILAYYGIYICAFSIGPKGNPRYLLPFGLVSMFSLLAIAYILVNAMTLMGQPDTWDAIWEKNRIGAATFGLGINSSDPALWLRYGTMFGIALVTSAVWMIFDAQCLIRKTDDENQKSEDQSYRLWAKWFATFFALVGALLVAWAFCSYLDVLKGRPVTAEWVAGNWGVSLFWAVMVLPFIVTFILLISGKSRCAAVLLLLLQLAVITSFAVFRQFVQNLEVLQVFDVSKLPTNVQRDVLITFLVVFVIGALVIAWMVRQVTLAPGTCPEETT